MNYYMHTSSVTGNTKKLANHFYETFKEELSIYDCSEQLSMEDLSRENTTIVLFFWCRKSSLDPKTLKLLKQLQGYKIVAMGTMGSYATGSYAEQVRNNVMEEINKNNTCLGVFLCRGEIPIERTLRRRRLPKDSRHYLDDVGYKRHISSHGHPDEDDLKKSIDFFLKCR